MWKRAESILRSRVTKITKIVSKKELTPEVIDGIKYRFFQFKTNYPYNHVVAVNVSKGGRIAWNIGTSKGSAMFDLKR